MPADDHDQQAVPPELKQLILKQLVDELQHNLYDGRPAHDRAVDYCTGPDNAVQLAILVLDDGTSVTYEHGAAPVVSTAGAACIRRQRR